MDASQDSTAVKRSRRWNPVAILAALPIVTFFLAVNIPGEVVLSPDILGNGKYGPHFQCYDRMTHGWPWIYASHDPVFGIAGYDRSAWRFTGGNQTVSVLALLFDLVVAVVATSLMVQSIIRWWSRQRLHFSLRALFLLIVCASLVLWWTTSRWRTHQSQIAFLGERYYDDATNGYAVWQPFGPWWLRELTGDEYWNGGDRAISVHVQNSALISRLPGKRDIQVLELGNLDYRLPPALDEFTNLVAIDVGCIATADDETNEDERDYRPCLQALACCKKLAGLNLYETGISNRDLEVVATMTNLQNLELSTNDRIDDEGLKYLASLKKLRRLALYRTGVTTAGVFELQKALPECEILWDPEQLN